MRLTRALTPQSFFGSSGSSLDAETPGGELRGGRFAGGAKAVEIRYVHSARRVVAADAPSTFPVGSPSAANDVSRRGSARSSAWQQDGVRRWWFPAGRRLLKGSGLEGSCWWFRSRRAAGGIRGRGGRRRSAGGGPTDGRRVDGVVFTAARGEASLGRGGGANGGGGETDG